MQNVRTTFFDDFGEPHRSLDERIAALLKVVEVDPANLEVRHRLMECAVQKGDWATYIYQAMDCAELEVWAGRRESAIDYYERILHLEERAVIPEYQVQSVMQIRQLVAQVKPEIYLRIGEYHLEAGRPEQAGGYLQRSAQLKPGVWDTHFALGKCYLAQGKNGNAAAEFRETLRLVVDYSPEMIPEIEQHLSRC